MRWLLVAGVLVAGCGFDWEACEAGDAGPGEEACDSEWFCGDALLYVSCVPSGETYACTCSEDGEEVADFEASDICGETRTPTEAEVNDGCGWSL